MSAQSFHALGPERPQGLGSRSSYPTVIVFKVLNQR